MLAKTKGLWSKIAKEPSNAVVIATYKQGKQIDMTEELRFDGKDVYLVYTWVVKKRITYTREMYFVCRGDLAKVFSNTQMGR